MAAEGKNKVAQSLLDLQPTAVLELFRIFPDRINKPTLFLGFHGGALYNQSVKWQGVQYLPLAMETEGFDILGDGKLPRPKLRVSNKNNLITNFLQNNKDLINAKIVRKKVQVKFLDDSNFDGGNPFGIADSKAELANETWLMGRKTQESKLFVEFELNSPLDLENFTVNSRNVISKFCYWQYRGEGCRYQGQPIEKEDGSPFLDAEGNRIVPTYESPANATAGRTNSPVDFLFDPAAKWSDGRVYPKSGMVWVESPSILVPPLQEDINESGVPLKTVYVSIKDDNIGQHPEKNPSYWQKDGCSKKLNACKKRFNTFDKSVLIAGDTEQKTFPTVRISGADSAESRLVPSSTGLFHTTEADITGTLTPTGEWTILGWVNINEASPLGAGIFSTSQKDDGVWPSARYLNIGVDTSNRGSSNVGFDLNTVSADYISYYLRKTSSSNTAFRSDQLHSCERVDRTVSRWHCYIITHQTGTAVFLNGQGVDEDTLLKIYVDGGMEYNEEGRDEGRLINNLGNFASYAERTGMTWDTFGTNALPQTFMLGAVEYFKTNNGYENNESMQVSSMNGQLATWALWNRALNEQERDYLRRPVLTPPDINSNLPFVPTNYYECTGLFSTLTGGTGDGLIGEHAPLLYAKDSLVAWWDGTTGLIPSTTDIGMIDIHTGGFHLTGSGQFTGRSETYYEGTLESVPNPTPANPRFGGFPGTDGFSYGRRVNLSS